ncbi:MAG TPA: hypothetical protein VE863_00115, partial [Pyrinomonadaceae bacterium]|nr:hypothetical protein [Pyrinomonadaceae bacterium]
MKFFVAVFLVLTMYSSGAVTLGQNPPRRTTQTSVPKPQPSKSDTIKICQGVPMPDGYVVVAYMTSAACPHGAYLLKKQADYESSLRVNGNAEPAANATNAVKTSAGGNNSDSASKKTSRLNSKPSSPSTALNASSSAQSTSSITRARRVTSPSQSTSIAQNTASVPAQVQDTDQSPDNKDAVSGPPTLIGGNLGRPPAPPTLKNAGAASADSATNSNDASSAQTEPEEVGEGDVVKVNTSL